MAGRILSPLDEAMIIGYFAATGIKDKDEQASVRQTLESDLLRLEREFRSAHTPADQQTPEWHAQMRSLKRDYLARREARVLHENQSAVQETIAALPELKSPWNIKAAEKARTHILYHEKMQGYGNAIIYNLPDELKTRPEQTLPQDTVRSDALYAMMYSLFSETNFVSDDALSLSERAIKKHLQREKKAFQSLLDDPKAFLDKIASMIQNETLPPELPETDMHKDEQEEVDNRRNDKQKTNSADSKDTKTGETDDADAQAQESEDEGADTAPVKTKTSDGSGDEPEEASRSAKDDFNQDQGEAPLDTKGKPRPYKVFTTAHDEVIRANELVDPQDLASFYKRLQEQCPDKPAGWREPNITRSLSTRVRTTFERRQSEGPHFDPSTLSQIVAAETRGETAPQDIRMQWKEVSEPDTCVTLLLDNSGSMRGAPTTYVAQFAEIFGTMLAKRGIPFEILGFTTKAWKGGQARQEWISAGSPKHPGRLNDLRHIIYKDMKMPWQRERQNLGALLQEGMLRENIDGEALEWAYTRSMQTHYRRRIIIPLLDGAPVDDSTLSTNDPDILQRHLHDVIARIEKAGKAELHAIGIGNYSTSQYFKNSYTMAHTENPYIAAGEILDSIANYAPGQERRIKSRLRMQRAHDAAAGRETGLGADRLKPK